MGDITLLEFPAHNSRSIMLPLEIKEDQAHLVSFRSIHIALTIIMGKKQLDGTWWAN